MAETCNGDAIEHARQAFQLIVDGGPGMERTLARLGLRVLRELDEARERLAKLEGQVSAATQNGDGNK